MIKEYEGEIYDYIGNDIKKKLVFDIGSNIGQMTQRFVKRGCKVVSVEPQKELTVNPNYKGVYAIENVCVSDNIEETTFYICGKHQSSSCLSGWGSNRHPKQKIVKTTIQTTTLDALIERYGKPKYIKIDVEGFEEKVLSGLSSKVDLISFEFVNGFTDKAIECINILKKKFGCKKLIAFMKKKIKRPGKNIVKLNAYTADITKEEDMYNYFNNDFPQLIKKANRDVGDILAVM